MPAEFPSNLPPPTVSQSGRSRSQVLSTEMSSGRYRQQLRFPDAGEQWTLNFEFTNTEFAAFKGWHHNTIIEGAAEFTIPLYVGGDSRTQTCQMVDGSYNSQHFSVLFWRVSFEVRFLDSEILNQEAIDALNLIEYGFDDFKIAVADFNELIETTLPSNL